MIHTLVDIAREHFLKYPMKRTHPDVDGGDVEYIDEGRRVRLRPDYYIWKLPSFLYECRDVRKVAEMYSTGRRPSPLGQVLQRSGSFFPWFGPNRRYFECYYPGTFPFPQ